MAAASRPDDALEVQLAETISQLTRGWMRYAREHARDLELTFPQLMVLGQLQREGRMPATHWAEMMGASPSAMTSLIDGLEAEGLVRRTHSLLDRRQVLVAITPRGRRLTDQLRADFMGLWKALCSDIPPARIESANSVLQELVRGLSTTGPAPAPRRPGHHIPRRHP